MRATRSVTARKSASIYAQYSDAARAFLDEVKGYQPPAPGENEQLVKLAQAGDAAALERLIQANMRLVVAIAVDYADNADDFLDLVQDGCEAFSFKAVPHYNPNVVGETGEPAKFSSYASWWIRQAVARGFDKLTHLIEIPEYVIMAYARVRRVAQHLETEGVTPTRERLLAAGCKAKDIDWADTMIAPPISLDRATVGEQNEDAYAVLGAEDDRITQINESESDDISRAMASLTTRERIAVEQHVINEQVLRETGTKLGGISRERARQINAYAIIKLRHKLLATRNSRGELIS